MPVEVLPGFDGTGPQILMRVTDDVEAAQAQGALAACKLALHMRQLDDRDRLEVTLNGNLLSWEGARMQVGGWTRQQVAGLFWAHYPSYPQHVVQETTLVEFDLAVPALRQGENVVEIHLSTGGSGASVVVDRVEITIAYKGQD